MGTNKLLNKLKEVLESDAETDERKRRDALKKLLKKLKFKQERLKEKLAVATGDEKIDLENKLELVKAHRTKGISVMRELKKNK